MGTLLVVADRRPGCARTAALRPVGHVGRGWVPTGPARGGSAGRHAAGFAANTTIDADGRWPPTSDPCGGGVVSSERKRPARRERVHRRTRVLGRGGRGRRRGRARGRGSRGRARPADAAAGKEPPAGRQDPHVRRHALQHHPGHRQPRHRRGLRSGRAASCIPPWRPSASTTRWPCSHAEGVPTKVEPTRQDLSAERPGRRRAGRCSARLGAAARRLALEEPLRRARTRRRRLSAAHCPGAKSWRGASSSRPADNRIRAAAPPATAIPGCSALGSHHRAAAAGAGAASRSPRLGRRSARHHAAGRGDARVARSGRRAAEASTAQPAAGRPNARACGSSGADRCCLPTSELSGPVVLDVSRAVSGHAQPQSAGVAVSIFCRPSPRPKTRDEFAACAAGAGQEAAAQRCFPRRCRGGWPSVLLADVPASPPERKVGRGEQADRPGWPRPACGCRLPLRGTRGLRKAEVTAGGVTLDEVDSRTMQSKRVPDLYFAGRSARPGRPDRRLQFSGRLEHGLFSRRQRVRRGTGGWGLGTGDEETRTLSRRSLKPTGSARWGERLEPEQDLAAASPHPNPLPEGEGPGTLAVCFVLAARS